MSALAPLGAEDVAELLAASAHGLVMSEDEHLDSLELASLIYEVERKWGVELVLDDEQLAMMSTVSQATKVLMQVTAGGRND
jgi:hypothetical protein